MRKEWHKDVYILRSLARLLWMESGTGLRLRLFGLVLLVLASALLNALTPLLFKALIDRFLSSPAAIPFLLIGAYITGQGLAKAAGELCFRLYGRIEQRVRRRLALRLFDHVHALSLRFHLDGRSGALQQVVGNGLVGYNIVLQQAVYIFIPLVFEFLMTCSVIAVMGKPVFVAVFFAAAVLYIAATIRGIRRQQEHQREAVAAQIDATAISADSYLNYETIKYFGAEDLLRERLDRSLTRTADGWTRFYDRRTVTGLSQALCLTFALAATLAIAAGEMSRGSMTVGGLVMVVTYLLQLLRPLDAFSYGYREIKTGIAYVEHILDLLSERPEVCDAPGARPLPPGPGELVFRNVEFAYDAGQPVLEGVSFCIPAGRTLAVVGPSGAGKSTLSRLLFRFYEATGGSIDIDGHALDRLTIESVRRAIAVVPQDTVLFNDTLAFNIGIARAGCRPEEIKEAARIAGIDDFIESLPRGYDTLVGERGLKLSGGERQRIAIARAVLKRPRIFALDEATSMLDSRTERDVLKNLEQTRQGATTLLITHRLSTAMHADEIVVLVGGRVVEHGPHHALLSAGGVYADLWEHQRQEAGGLPGGGRPGYNKFIGGSRLRANVGRLE